MPLYEYECENGHRFEKIQKFSDPPIDKCPTCGAVVRKLMSSPAIQFKGTGWYITDYARKEAPTKSDKPEGTKEAGADGKSDAKTEAKPETKAETKTEKKTEPKSETKSAPGT